MRPCIRKLATAPLVFLCAAELSAATITVTSLADIVAIDGQVTLREAIVAANTDTSIDGSTPGSGADSIVFATGGGTITLSGAQLPIITDDLTITGLGASSLTIDANDQSRVFQIGAGVTAHISALTIHDGRSESVNGGGIFNSGTLTLDSVTLTSNKTDFDGGAVYNADVLGIENSTLSGNSAQNGGGVRNSGSLTIQGSTLSGNFTGGIAPFAGGGGAIGNDGSANLSTSTIDGNTAANGGGVGSFSGDLLVTSSTLSENTALNSGGGITVTGGTIRVQNSTITGNRANSNGDAIGTGGGIRSAGTVLALFSTIVAGNFEGVGATLVDIDGLVGTSAYNLVGVDTRMTGMTDGVSGNQVGTAGAPIDPLLGGLENNGGPTATHAVLSTSPALDAGSNSICPSTDQRGEDRPADGDGDGASVCDIGAFELGGLVATKTVGGDTVENGTITYTIVISNQRSLTQGDNPGDELTDTLPDTLTAISAGASSGTALRSGNTVIWNGSIPPAGSVTITVDATVNPGTFGAAVVNQGTVKFDSDDDGTNDRNLLTDDPSLSGSADPTMFLVGSGPTDFYTLSPCRLIDTRDPPSPLGGPALDAGSDRTFVVINTCGVPSTAKAISLNIAITQPTSPGNLRLHPGGSPVPTVSSINYASGQTRSNNAVAVLNASGEIAVFVGQVSGTVHLILDVNGYFE